MLPDSVNAPLALFFVLLASIAGAQEFGTIRASTTVLGDGTRSLIVSNPDNGTMEETVTTASGKALRKTVYQVDEAGQPRNAIFYDGKGKITSKAVYQRDATGRIERETIFSANDQVLRKRVYQYGAKNKVSAIAEFDADGRPIARPVAPSTSRGRPDKKRR
jgi:hypothetical protein